MSPSEAVPWSRVQVSGGFQLPPTFTREISRMDVERRISARNPPSYTLSELRELRIDRVHFRDRYMFCLLSDGNMVCVPLTISAVLVAGPQRVRYQWKIADDGQAVVWYTQGM